MVVVMVMPLVIILTIDGVLCTVVRDTAVDEPNNKDTFQSIRD